MAPVTHGIHHLGLTVSDVVASASFFIDVLGFDKVGEKPEYPAVFVSDGSVMLTLWQAASDARAFDRKHNIGLHHAALRVADSNALSALHERLRATDGVAIEFAPEALGTGRAQHMMCRVPGGVRVEFIAAPA